MEDIKVGMYARTKYGFTKIQYIKTDMPVDDVRIGYFGSFFNENGEIPYLLPHEIIKASFNKRDLIEEDDYINGHRVVYIDDEIIQVDCAGWIESDEKRYLSYQVYEEDIKSIVTKEQFKEREYIFEE